MCGFLCLILYSHLLYFVYILSKFYILQRFIIYYRISISMYALSMRKRNPGMACEFLSIDATELERMPRCKLTHAICRKFLFLHNISDGCKTFTATSVNSLVNIRWICNKEKIFILDLTNVWDGLRPKLYIESLVPRC